jgi:uncharacterized protein
MRKLINAVLIFGVFSALCVAAFLGKGYWNATRDPIIRKAAVKVADWPEGVKPVTILLMSDTHVAGPDMPPERLVRIVGDLNKLNPDLILIAGDLVSEKRVATHIYTPKEVVAPLGGLKAPLGVIVAPGNHDHWFDPDALRGELEAIGLKVLQNDAVQAGPLVVGGADDDFTDHDDLRKTYAAMDKLPKGPRILVTHSPDLLPDLPSPVAAVFAGHTHCGQMVLKIFETVFYGEGALCGDINSKGQRAFISAGLGTSMLPLRYNAAPDVWLVTMEPQ